MQHLRPLLALGSQTPWNSPAERPQKQTHRGGKGVAAKTPKVLSSPSSSAAFLVSLLFKCFPYGQKDMFLSQNGLWHRVQRMFLWSQGPLGTVNGASRFSA